MAITYFGSASNPADSSTAALAGPTVAVTPPGSMVAGDLVIVVLQYRGNTSGFNVSVTGGQSWSLGTTRQSVNAVNQIRVLRCTFNGTWAANPTFSNVSGTLALTASMHVFRPSSGVNAWAIDVSEQYLDKAAALTFTVAGITTAAASVAFAVAASDDDNTWTTTGTGWLTAGSAQYRNTTGSDQSHACRYKLMPSGGATGDVVFTEATLGSDAGQTVCLSLKEVVVPLPITPISGNAVTFNFDATTSVDWGDGSAISTSSGTGSVTHTYSSSSPVTVLLSRKPLTLAIDVVGVTALDPSALTTTTYLDCSANNISSLDVSAMTALQTLYCQDNAPLTSLTVTGLANLVDVRAATNALSAAQVNAVLAVLVASGKTNGIVDLSSNTAPTGQGLTDVTTLRGRGWTVTVDSAGGGSVTGTASSSQAAQTETTAGKETFRGTATGSQTAQSESVAAKEKFTATATASQAAQAEAIAAKETITGTETSAQAAQTESVAAKETFSATATSEQVTQTESVAAVETITATAESAQAQQEETANDRRTIRGDAVQARAAQSESAAGVLTFTATATQDQAAQQAVAGKFAIRGGVTAAQSAQQETAAGREKLRATITAAQAHQTLAATGTLQVVGSIAQIQAQQSTIAGTVPTISGTVESAQASQTQVIRSTITSAPVFSDGGVIMRYTPTPEPVRAPRHIRGSVAQQQSAQSEVARGAIKIMGKVLAFQPRQGQSGVGTVIDADLETMTILMAVI